MRRTEAGTAEDAFLAKAHTRNLQADAERLDKEIVALEASLETAKRDCDDCERHIKGLVTGPVEVRDTVGKSGVTSDADTDEASALYERKVQLLDLLEANKAKVTESEQAEVAKEHEYAAAAPLLEKQAISRSEVTKLADDVRMCRLVVQNNEAAVKRCEEELRDLPSQIGVLKRSRWKERLEEKQHDVSSLETALTDLRRQQEGLAEVIQQDAPLARKVKDAEAELAQLQGEMAAMRQLHDNEAAEFAVLAPAVPAAAPILSTRKMVTAFAFAVPMLLFCGLVVGYERVKGARTPAASLEKLGLTVLTSPPRSYASLGRGIAAGDARGLELRRVALGIRERVAGAGKVVLFSSSEWRERNTRPGVSDRPAVGGAGPTPPDSRRPRRQGGAPQSGRAPPPPEPFSSGASDGNAAARGMVLLLASASDEWPVVVRRTPCAAVDYLPIGASSDPDLLASKQMSVLLTALSQNYSRIIILASPLSQALDAELLASHVNAIILTLNTRGERVSPRSEEAVRSLQERRCAVAGRLLSVSDEVSSHSLHVVRPPHSIFKAK